MRLYVPVIAPKLLDTLEYVSPLGKGGDGIKGISNITLLPCVFSWEPMSPSAELHEAIHVYQQLECGVVAATLLTALGLVLGWQWWVIALGIVWAFAPFIGAFYLVYGATWLWWRVRAIPAYDGTKAGQVAYHLIPFERESYLRERDGLDYLDRRPWFAWVRIGAQELETPALERAEHYLGTIVTMHRHD